LKRAMAVLPASVLAFGLGAAPAAARGVGGTGVGMAGGSHNAGGALGVVSGFVSAARGMLALDAASQPALGCILGPILVARPWPAAAGG